MSANTEERDNSPFSAEPPQPPTAGRVGGWPGLVRRTASCFGKRAKGAPRRLNWPLAALLLLGGVSIPVWRATTSHALPQTSPAVSSALPIVAAARVERQDLYNEVTIPAEFRPQAEVELHAKISGYVQALNVDIGDRVKAGQLLARLEVPELQDELDRAKAALKRAEADYQEAHLVYSRLLAVDKQHPNLVAQQELDSAEAKDHMMEAALAAAKAEVGKNQTLQAYTRITAPFDGVVTHRYADPGALIQAGTASQTQSLPLVRLSDNYRLRLDFPVSVGYVKDIHPGDVAEVRVESLGGQTFTGKITRSTSKVNEDTRTMMTEMEVPNPKLELMPGMYAKVVLKVEKRPRVLTIPVEAVAAGKQAAVYVLNSQQEVEERSVTLGLETPTRYEIQSGLKEGELVLIGRRAEVRPGEKVQAKVMGPLAQE